MMAALTNQADQRNPFKMMDLFVLIIGVGMALFHMYTASFGIMPSYAQSAIHWGFIGSYILLTRPLSWKYGRIIDAALIGLNLYICYYQLVLQDKFILTGGVYTRFEVYLSIAAILLVLEIARRVIGKILPVISVLFIAYGLWGNVLSGVFKTVKFTLTRIAPYLYTSSDGLFGQTLYVSAQFIFLFVLFGSILELTGAGEFFVNLAYSLTGRARGGPAQAAIYSSMLMGTINGSGAANVVTTGTFTIPLMKKVGFKPSMAGAVEAVASSGGQIMPPVMGAVAFLMSEITGIEYATIVIASLLPAILYYLTLSFSVYFTARKDNIPAMPKEEMIDFWATIKAGWLYFIPLLTLVILLVSGYSAQKAAFFGIIMAIVIGFIANKSNMTLDNFIKALKGASAGIAPIAAACILAGVIMGIINMTGLGLKISGIIESIAAGRLIVALVLAMLTSLILGMGLPTSAAYMILAVLVAPAVIKMGVTPLAAHLFILYFGALSTITPPVALSTFAAAGIAGANIWKTGLDAMKLASSGFIIPFIFAFNYDLLLNGEPLGIVISIITAIIGCYILSASLIGWLKQPLSIWSRILLFPCAVMLIISDPLVVNVIGAAAALIIFILEFSFHRKKNNNSRQPIIP